ncbi:MAG: hypothetical protein Q9208_004496 [Pyrenodesmia sp. 3 TL-2023]
MGITPQYTRLLDLPQDDPNNSPAAIPVSPIRTRCSHSLQRCRRWIRRMRNARCSNRMTPVELKITPDEEAKIVARPARIITPGATSRDANLRMLPAKIFINITLLLSDSSMTALSQTCQSFYRDAANIKTLRKLDKERRMKYEGLLWICPSRVWSREEVLNFLQNPQSFPSGPCPCNQHFTGLFHRFSNYVGHSFDIIVQAYPIDTFQNQNLITQQIVEDSLASSHLRICRHAGRGGPRVRHCFSERCIRTFDKSRRDCSCQSCKAPRVDISRMCMSCGTQTQFRLQRHAETGDVTLYLLVGRVIKETGLWFDDNDLATDWRDYVFAPEEIEGLQKEWETHTAGRVEDPGHARQMISKARDPFDIPEFVW